MYKFLPNTVHGQDTTPMPLAISDLSVLEKITLRASCRIQLTSNYIMQLNSNQQTEQFPLIPRPRVLKIASGKAPYCIPTVISSLLNTKTMEIFGYRNSSDILLLRLIEHNQMPNTSICKVCSQLLVRCLAISMEVQADTQHSRTTPALVA